MTLVLGEESRFTIFLVEKILGFFLVYFPKYISLYAEDITVTLLND